jgi:hypothetical protein
LCIDSLPQPDQPVVTAARRENHNQQTQDENRQYTASNANLLHK